jgi:hypothetical protein
MFGENTSTVIVNIHGLLGEQESIPKINIKNGSGRREHG